MFGGLTYEKEVIVASNNKDKIREIKEILKKFNIDALSMKEAGIDIDIEEDGNTFMENAYKKQLLYMKFCLTIW